MELDQRLDLSRQRVREQRLRLLSTLDRHHACLEQAEAGRRSASARLAGVLARAESRRAAAGSPDA